ncbi:fluoride efflux transporter CrcB [Aquibacillus kalidii]|uniref:fluoride efflux transporter CrcB n=1 Tax=Aquibacillus kalidii TaxID=2762597 RepID=UPI00164464C4|nr:fluoride efflux transporter CrcB [Aquibacillus kalidii]
MNLILVSLGGFFGAITRYLMGVKFNQPQNYKPYGTWIANILGSILLGLMLVFLGNEQISSQLWALLGVGFCGSFTTFSTFGVETLSMVIDGQYKKATLYVISSIFLSMLIVWCIIILL